MKGEDLRQEEGLSVLHLLFDSHRRRVNRQHTARAWRQDPMQALCACSRRRRLLPDSCACWRRRCMQRSTASPSAVRTHKLLKPLHLMQSVMQISCSESCRGRAVMPESRTGPLAVRTHLLLTLCKAHDANCDAWFMRRTCMHRSTAHPLALPTSRADAIAIAGGVFQSQGSSHAGHPLHAYQKWRYLRLRAQHATGAALVVQDDRGQHRARPGWCRDWAWSQELAS